MNTSWIRVSVAISVVGVAFAGALAQLDSSSAFADDSSQAGSRAAPLVAGPNRPANVPEGYLITPFGYFHPSCVQRLAKGESVLPDGRVQHADGTVAGKAAVCNYPRYTPKGILMSAAPGRTQPGNNSARANTSAEINGWIEQESIVADTPTKSYGAMLSIWVVPPQPRAKDGQILYIFPGFEDIDNTESILQPVLQWSAGQWAIASWNCCLNNVAGESPLVNVRPGDIIYGSISSTCRAGTVYCPTWNVFSLDITTGQSTILAATPSEGQQFNWAFAGALEPYYVVSCDDYPPNRHIAFGNLTLDQNLRPIVNPKWGGSVNTTQTPQCNYGIAAKPHEITLHY